MTIWTSPPSDQAVIIKRSYTPPYQRTGRVLTDALLFTCHAYGAKAIKLSGGVISCTYNGQPRSIPIRPRMSCIEVIDGLFNPPVVTGMKQLNHGGGEQGSDPSVDQNVIGVHKVHYHKLSKVSREN